MSNVPLPRPGPLGLIQYAGVDMLQYAGAVSAAKDAEIAALRADFAALQRAIVGDTGASAILEAGRLRAEVAGLREDAERYRWLRDPHNQDCHSVGKCAPGIERYEAIDWLYDDELDVSIDAAIDAARKGEA